MVWAFGKMLSPTHDGAILESFYGVSAASASLIREIGVVQSVIVLAILADVARS